MADPRPAHVHRIRVRPVDCDRRGVVHASRYPIFFEAAMVETVRSLLGSYRELEKHGVEFAVAETSVRYLGEAGFDDMMRINVRVRTLGSTTMTLGFEAEVDGTPVAVGWTRYTACGTPEPRHTPIPDELRRALEQRTRATRNGHGSTTTPLTKRP
ncbi:acyl-CoA thioesterase [Actinosynnema pretiosum]|uniref:Thioesterase n=1 Tax=Actinosynnema pretiosum TaxID=42197 RepID=A0A290Z432_9PSEU|nr:thioesterase family protein [Actinosynnema pretiosum]ATE53719.1 thioesterase [Actinosynnema pretiosum]